VYLSRYFLKQPNREQRKRDIHYLRRRQLTTATKSILAMIAQAAALSLGL
jgi:hypothetical protein